MPAQIFQNYLHLTVFGRGADYRISLYLPTTHSKSALRKILILQVQSQFRLKCRLENSGTSKMEVQLFLTNPKTDSLLWCGISGKMLGPLPPHAYLDIELHAICVKPGLLDVDGVRILDLNSSKTYEFDNITRILVHSTDESPIR